MGGAPIMRHPVSLCYPSAFPHGKSLSALEMKFCDTWALPCTNKATFVLGCGYRALLRRIPRAKNVMKISAEGFPVQASAVYDSLLMEAAKQTVDAYISSGMVLGLGTGLASCMAIQYLGQKLQTGILGNILGVPMSSLSAAEAAKVGVPLISFENITKLDFAFDDADLVEESTLAAIIGRRSAKGCESIIKEKAVLKAANDLALIVNEEKYTNKLDGAIPVIVRQENWMQIAEEIDDLFLGDAEVWRRPMFGDAGPLGGDFPLVTIERHYVLDVIFTSPIVSLAQVAKCLEEINGIVEHGLILDTPLVPSPSLKLFEYLLPIKHKENMEE